MTELFNKLIEVRDISHQIHLSKTDSGFHHEALEEFYTDLLDHTDKFIEVYQGQYGLIEDFGTFDNIDYSDHVKYFEEFATYINDKRKDIDPGKSVHLEAIIDDIVISTYKLLYKIKNLK